MYQLPDEAAVVLLIHTTTDQIKLAKRAFNAPGRPDWKVWQHLPRLKRAATVLCAAQAVRHKRTHRSGWTPHDQLQFVAEHLPAILAEALPQAA